MSQPQMGSGVNQFHTISGHARIRPYARHQLSPGKNCASIHAPAPVRADRLRRRSPDLLTERPAEAEVRLAEGGAAGLARAHLVVDNHGAGEPVAADELLRLLRLLASRAPARSPG